SSPRTPPAGSSVPPSKVVAQPVAQPFKRRDVMGEFELATMLQQMPEVDLDAVEGSSAKILTAARQSETMSENGNLHPADKRTSQARAPVHVLPDLLAQRSDLTGLPMQKAKDCQASAGDAAERQKISRDLRREMARLSPRPSQRQGQNPSPSASQS